MNNSEKNLIQKNTESSLYQKKRENMDNNTSTKNEKENIIMSDCIKYNAFRISRPNIETLNIQLNYPIDEYYDEWRQFI